MARRGVLVGGLIARRAQANAAALPASEPSAALRWPAHQIESWEIGRLKPYANNTKKHSPAHARGWTEDQCRAYGIADNRLTETSEWDEKLLKLELGELLAVGFDPHLTGFDGADLDKLILADGGESTKKARKGQGELSPVIQFNIVFDNEQQQEAWFGFVRQLKVRGGDAGRSARKTPGGGGQCRELGSTSKRTC
jgi:hypothetical protein